jgi:transcriptional regulator with XRE-family HTH domain
MVVLIQQQKWMGQMSDIKANLLAVGAYLRRLRQEQELSITETAAALKTTEAQIRQIELGRRDTRGSMLVNHVNLLGGNWADVAELMLSQDADEERARTLAERWIAQRQHQARRVAEPDAPGYHVNGSAK